MPIFGTVGDASIFYKAIKIYRNPAMGSSGFLLRKTPYQAPQKDYLYIVTERSIAKLSPNDDNHLSC